MICSISSSDKLLNNLLNDTLFNSLPFSFLNPNSFKNAINTSRFIVISSRSVLIKIEVTVTISETISNLVILIYSSIQ
ncbi:hypothetical protein CJ20_068 [Escherichia phage CJ20]|nr:hypothetical protein CJ20_068 [Escherichia phage CJ20]